MSDSLILNADGNPLCLAPFSAVPWQISIKAYFSESMGVVNTYDTWVVHTPKVAYKVPSVVILKKYISYERTIPFTRKNVFIRDNYTCQYCGIKPDNKTLTLDHIIPRSKGGASVWENVVTCCKPCNQIKCDKEIPIKHNSFMPSYWDIVKRLKKRPISIHHHWLPYIDWPEDLITVTKRAA